MQEFVSSLVSVAFHGLAYGMILYVISVGLSVTMGLMGFVNLAHGVFAMAGGYVMLSAMNGLGVPFPLALVAAFIAVALASMVLERLLYARLYTAGELEQVLFTIGLIFMSVAVARLVYGPLPQPVIHSRVPEGAIAFPRPRLPDLPRVPHRLQRCDRRPALVRRRTHPLGGHGARSGRLPRHGAVGGYQHLAAIHAHLCTGQRARRPRRRARRRHNRDPADATRSSTWYSS